MTHYSRALEKEADLAGYQLAEASGFDARLAVTALSKLGDQPDVHPWIANIYGTHPLLSNREDRLAALGGEEPEEVAAPEPAPEHQRNLTQGLAPFDPPVPIAVRLLAPDGKRWENPWRKNFTKRLHLHLLPLGFSIAGDDLMYKPDIGDPVAAARSRSAAYLLLVTVSDISSVETGGADLQGTPVRATVDMTARLLSVADGAEVWAGSFAHEQEGRDLLRLDPETLFTDSCVGGLAEQAAAEIALGAAKAAGAKPAPPEKPKAGTSAAAPTPESAAP
jgi:hypothetical protein